MTELVGTRALIVGGSRGLGRGITAAFARAGADVVALARTDASLAELAAAYPKVRTETADATDARVAARLIDEVEPHALIVVAGATPVMRALTHHTWETFSVTWETDVKIAFTWLRGALLKPLPAGSKVVLVSSGAALNGSPLSGGYAGAKATQRFIARYAHGESQHAHLGIAFTTVLPRMTPFGDVGAEGIRAYAAQNGQTPDEFIQRLGPLVTPEVAGMAVVDLATSDAANLAEAYVLTGAGLQPLP